MEGKGAVERGKFLTLPSVTHFAGFSKKLSGVNASLVHYGRVKPFIRRGEGGLFIHVSIDNTTYCERIELRKVSRKNNIQLRVFFLQMVVTSCDQL